jgi:RNA polymerase sigma factor (sigma-70 family)
VQKERIPTAWIKEQIRICLQETGSIRATAQRKLAERLWPAALHIAISNQQRNAILASCSPHIAEDAAMYAYTLFLQTLHDQHERKDVNRWFHTTISHFMQRETRRHKAELTTGDILLFDRAAPSTLAEAVALRASMLRTLRHLQAKHRHVLFLRHWGDYSHRSIAEHWGVSKQWVSLLELEAMSALWHKAQRAASRR